MIRQCISAIAASTKRPFLLDAFLAMALVGERTSTLGSVSYIDRRETNQANSIFCTISTVIEQDLSQCYLHRARGDKVWRTKNHNS